MMNTNGVLHNQIKMFDKNMSHFGLDIVVSPRARGKTEFQLELRDFDLLNKGISINSPEFPKNNVAELFDNVIKKYFETKSTSEPKVEKISYIEVKGKVIKGVRKVNESYEVITHDPNPSKELNATINKIVELKGLADIKVQEQMIKCADALRVGTLDMPNNTELVVHTKNGAERFNGKVSRDQLIATIWFISKAYMGAPSFRKHLNVSVSDGHYTIGYKNGLPVYEDKNLSQIEKDILSDLASIQE